MSDASFGNEVDTRPVSRNLNVIESSIKSSDILGTVLFYRIARTIPEDLTPRYMAVVIAFSHLSFMVAGGLPVFETFQYELSQRCVYAVWSDAPIFTIEHGSTINLNYMFHLFNFWKHNLTKRSDSESSWLTLHDYDQGQRPRAWDAPLKVGALPLKGRWMNAYGMIRLR